MTGIHSAERDVKMLDVGLPARMRRLRDLSLTAGPDPELDAVAHDLGEALDAPYTMVNFRLEAHQHFAGLHTPGPSSYLPPVGRTMPLDHGYCPEVMSRRLALILTDVYASPRFASNAVVDLIGIRFYAGVPIITPDGIVLGALCAIGTEPRPLSEGRHVLGVVKEHRDTLMDVLNSRA